MSQTKMPGEDEQDIILYMRDDQDLTAAYALVSLILIKRENHFYIYSEKAWVSGGSVTDSEAHYEDVTQKIVSDSVQSFEDYLCETYQVSFSYPLLYNNALVYLMVTHSNDHALEENFALFDQLLKEEEDIDPYLLSSDDYKRRMTFLHWLAFICAHSDIFETRYESIIEEMLKWAEMIPLDEVDLFVLDAYEMAGDYYSSHNNEEKALYYYELVLSFANVEKDPMTLIITREKAGDMHRLLKQYQEAIPLYQKAIDALEKRMGNDEVMMIQMATLKQDLGRCFDALAKREPAEKCFLAEEDILKKVADLYQRKDNEHNYIIALRNIAAFYAQGKLRKDLEKAIECYELELHFTYIYEHHYGNPDTSLSLAHAYHALGEMYLRYHDEQEIRKGIDYLEKDAEILTNRYQVSHLEKQGLDMAIAYHEISKAYALVSTKETIDALETALEAFKDVFHDYPRVLNFKNYLLVSSQLGEYLESNEDFERVLNLYNENVLWAKKLAEKKEEYRIEYARALYYLGELYALQDGEFYVHCAIDSLSKVIRLAIALNVKEIEMDAKETLGSLYMRINDDNSAGELFSEVLDYRKGRSTYELGRAYENLGRLYAKMGEAEDLRQAYAYHEHEEEVFEDVYQLTKKTHDYRNIMIAKKQMAEIAIKRNTKESLEKAITLYEEINNCALEISDESKASHLERLGDAHRKLGDKEHLLAAIHCYKEAGFYKINGDAYAFSRLEKKRGYVHELLKDFASAKECYEEHLKIVSHLYASQRGFALEVATGERNMGMIERRLKNLKESLAHLQKELRLRMQIYHETPNDENRYLLAGVHRTMGEDYEMEKEWGKALAQYRIFAYHMKELSEQKRYLQSYMVAIEKLGNVYKRFDDREHLLRAVDCYKKVYDYVSLQHNDHSMVTILQKLAYVYAKVGQFEKAMQLYEKQEKILESLASVDERYLEDYANCLTNQGVLLRESDPESARVLFERVIALSKDETTPMRLLHLGNTYRMLGDLTKEKQYYLEALDCFDHAPTSHAKVYKEACLKALKGLDQ